MRSRGGGRLLDIMGCDKCGERKGSGVYEMFECWRCKDVYGGIVEEMRL